MARSRWYVLYTSPRAEKRVKERLDANQVESYLPLHRCPRVWSDRIKLVDIPLITSYIFIRCKESELFKLLRLSGVVRVVYYNGKPAVIRQAEIDAIQQFIEEAKEKILCTGDEVEILTGSMKKRFGKIVRIQKKYMLLHIEQLAATVCVNTLNVTPLRRY